MLSREGLRKLAVQGQGLSREAFLTLVCARLMQVHDLVDPAPMSPGEAAWRLGKLLGELPAPTGNNAWSLFHASPTDGEQAETFWQALCAAGTRGMKGAPDALGWMYQYYLEPGLEMFRSAGSRKIGPRHLAPRTQQFTPRWIADFLAQNTLGRLWLQMHPDSRLRSGLPYLIRAIDPVAAKPVKDITILDPACGTMHLGLPVLDLLTRMYREELRNAGKPGWPAEPSVRDEREIPAAIISHNLYGIDIDPLALELAALTLYVGTRGNGPCRPHLLCADTLSPEFDPAAAGFPTQFDIVLLNPPYLDKREYPQKLKSFMARQYPESGRNLYTAFLERSLDFLAPGGLLGAVTPQTFMFIRSFRALRQLLLDRTTIETLVHTGLNTFDDAVVDCAFYVLQRQDDPAVRAGSEGRFIQLTDLNSPEQKQARLMTILKVLRGQPGRRVAHAYEYRPQHFSALPESPWVYWISPRIRELFSTLPPLGRIADLRQGLATTDNNRFLRYWWEIPRDHVATGCRNLADAAQSGKTWFPYLKGGGYMKWFGGREYLVNWGEDGREIKAEITRRYRYLKGKWQWVAKNTEFYFREGISYSYLTSGKFSARYSPPGSIFDVAGSSIFCDDIPLVLAILNSRFCRFALGLINPTVNFQVGDLQRLPVPAKPCPPELRNLVHEAIDIARSIEAFDETSPDFTAPPPWPDGCGLLDQKNRRLMEIQGQVDRWVYELYGLAQADQRLIEQLTSPDEAPAPLTPEALAFRWISYTVGTIFGRHGGPAAADWMLPVLPNDREGLAGQTRLTLERLLGPAAARDVIDAASPTGCLHEFLAAPFFQRHFRQFQHRPIYWLLQRKTALYCLYYPALDPVKYDQLSREWKLKPTNKHAGFRLDDGVRHNLKPFRRFLALNAWTRAIAQLPSK